MTYYDKFLEKLKTIQYLKSLQKLRNQHGAVFALTALLVPVLFGFMGLGYDVGNLYLHKARLQDTADATSLAGARGYVNELKKGSSTGVISLPTGSNDTLTKRNNAIAALKTNADNYIANNNPVFQDKLQNDNRTEKFYSIGKEVTSSDRNNSTEYFRVVLSEPVQLYFLPVIGIKSSADVSVYATTKLSDNEIVEGGSPNPQDAENRPVVIAGSVFFDEINTNDLNNPYNFYNTSTVYVQEGGTITGIKHNGKNVVPSSEGDIIINGKRYAEIVETKYDMDAFGKEIQQRFREKQESYLKTLSSEIQSYVEIYKSWKSSYPYTDRYTELIDIWNKIDQYTNLEYANALAQWNNDGKPVSSDFQKIWDMKYDHPKPDANKDWRWDKYKDFYMIPPPVYTGSGTIPNNALDEYYMTYHGSIGNISNLSTMDISKNPSNYGLLANEHSYLYISRAALNPPTDDGNISEINVNGFYVSTTPTTDDPIITTDTPYYIFIDADMHQRVNVKVTADCNRPLILCYLGTTPVHYEFSANTKVKGVFYSPHAGDDTLVNGTAQNVEFSGSIISDYIKIQSRNTSYKYDPSEVKKWQDASEGLPVTPNTGFTSSSSGGDNPTVETEKITIPDHLRLVLASSITDDSHYNQARVSWELIK